MSSPDLRDLNSYQDVVLALADTSKGGISSIVVNEIGHTTKSEKETLFHVLRLLYWDTICGSTDATDSQDIESLRNNDFVDNISNVIISQNKDGDLSFPQTKVIINDIIRRRNGIRDLIYQKEKDFITSDIITQKSLADFIATNPYREFLLLAKYKLSLMVGTPFLEAIEVLDDFPESDILPIEAIRQLIKTVNGIQFLFSGDAISSPLLQETILSLFSSLTPTSQTSSVYIQSEPIKVSLWKDIVDNCTNIEISSEEYQQLHYELSLYGDFDTNNENDSGDSIISTYKTYNSFIKLLNSLFVGCTVDFPTKDQILQSHTLPQYIKYLWVNDNTVDRTPLIIRCSDCKSVNIPPNNYGCCMLAVYNTRKDMVCSTN